MNPFVEAISVLEQNGWVRNPKPNGHQICIGLAVERVAHLGDSAWDYALDRETYEFLQNYTRERYGRSIIDANDNIIHSQTEAINVLRECARRWETRNTVAR